MVIMENIDKKEFDNVNITLQDIAAFRLFLRSNIYSDEVIDQLVSKLQTSFGNAAAYGLTIYIEMELPTADSIINPVTAYGDIYKIFAGLITYDLVQEILFSINNISTLTKKQKLVFKTILYRFTVNPYEFDQSICSINMLGNTIAVSL